MTPSTPHRTDGSALAPRTLRGETLLVLALSLGASAVSALISFIGSVTKPGALKNQAATLVGTQAPGRPWLDLAWQLFSVGTALVPVALVAHLLVREGVGMRSIGFDLRRPRFDLAWGALIAAGIGGTGLAFYLGARVAGFNLTVVPESLPDVRWRIPVLVAAAVQNAVVEEVIVVGYLLRRLDQLGWRSGAALAVSAVLRGSYHLYQGIGGFVGNLAMGVIFVLLYRRWGRVGPLVAAHALIDTVAFVGYVLLAGKVGWLPTK
ncbi:CPBP family intramembrane glutamic endopeptidase [Streptantibioticus rubrisoli]|uniref:CPBP family intramembrane metalloprotease n=1 Tax=Streptantibioticus rubrisoli TaxID=1387313 RepID=A0ABT1PNZ1_9ACTN|nr:type II CAAX endopeptidase family protein [Streptantibioticus rubrisoli]MCQ4046308.1 CPBP family intramembrane metalloprotease [Streptantibioticus rubrisoli]